jgi:hypothetical protein
VLAKTISLIDTFFPLRKIEANAKASRLNGKKAAQRCRGDECSFCRRTPELKDRDALSLEGKKVV